MTAIHSSLVAYASPHLLRRPRHNTLRTIPTIPRLVATWMHAHLLVQSSAVLLVGLHAACRPTSAYTPTIPPRPTRVELDHITQSYPVTLMSKLFSSVPKRDRALDDVTLAFGGDDANVPNVLVGRSGSGKSTLLRLLSGGEEPTEGTVLINGVRFNPIRTGSGGESTKSMSAVPRPVILDRKPPSDDSHSVFDRIVASASAANKKEIDPSLVRRVATDFASVLGLTPAQLESKSSSLTPSGQFLFGIACGCVESVLPALSDTCTCTSSRSTTTDEVSEDFLEGRGMPYPILLLDELFDFEHPSVPRACRGGLENLVSFGGVVVIATHRPHHWEGLDRRRVLTLSSGRVLTDETVGRQGPPIPIDST